VCDGHVKMNAHVFALCVDKSHLYFTEHFMDISGHFSSLGDFFLLYSLLLVIDFFRNERTKDCSYLGISFFRTKYFFTLIDLCIVLE